MPVPQPAAQPYPGRDAQMMYGAQPGMMLTAQPMQQGQRSGAMPQVNIDNLTQYLLLHWL